MSPTPQNSYQVSAVQYDHDSENKKTTEKRLLTYFAISKFVLHGEIELT